MDYYNKLQRYLTATCNTLQSSYEWYVHEYNKKDNDVSYLAAISCIESYRDDMQGAVAFAHFSDLISEEQFNEAWDLMTRIFSVYSIKIWDLFFPDRKEG